MRALCKSFKWHEEHGLIIWVQRFGSFPSAPRQLLELGLHCQAVVSAKNMWVNSQFTLRTFICFCSLSLGCQCSTLPKSSCFIQTPFLFSLGEAVWSWYNLIRLDLHLFLDSYLISSDLPVELLQVTSCLSTITCWNGVCPPKMCHLYYHHILYLSFFMYQFSPKYPRGTLFFTTVFQNTNIFQVSLL